jgi:DNA adenine methylase
LEEDLSEAHLRLARVTIEHLDWRECVRRYDRPTTLFYCDPPYLGVAGYGVPFPESEYVDLAEHARNMKGACIISLNDCPEVRHIFAGFKVRQERIRYTVGGNRPDRAEATELVILNARATR